MENIIGQREVDNSDKEKNKNDLKRSHFLKPEIYKWVIAAGGQVEGAEEKNSNQNNRGKYELGKLDSFPGLRRKKHHPFFNNPVQSFWNICRIKDC
jgi:hypothetical protein